MGWRVFVNYMVDKVVMDEMNNVKVMRAQRRKAATYMKEYYAKRRKGDSAPAKTMPRVASPESSWEGSALYPDLETPSQSDASSEAVRAVMGNSGFNMVQRRQLALKVQRTMKRFQEKGVFGKERDRQYERFLDE